MRWRPTLAALGALAVAAALLVAMSSASSPTVSTSGIEPAADGAAASRPPPPEAAPAAVDNARDPTAARVPEQDEPHVAAEPDDGPVSGAADELPLALAALSGGSPSTFDSLLLPDQVPPICPDPSDPLFNLYTVGVDCYWLVIVDEEHRELTPEELELIQRVPVVSESAAEPLGRPARKIRRGPPGESGSPRLYLTFDDGPSRRWTRPTLDLLDRYGARATFFPVGAYASLNFDLVEEIHARGHTIGTHLWSHELATLYDEDLFRQELRASADLLGDHLTNCLRTPYGITNDEIFEWAGDEGFEIVLWGDVDPLDWQAPSIEDLTQRILDGVQNGTILLLHERTGANTLAALEAVLAALDARGWIFDEPICPLQF